MPDISLLIELAEFYDISIPEIVNGERKNEKMNEEVFGDDRSYHDDRFKINNDDEADRLLCD